MSTIGGPNITENGLVLHLDAANPKSYPGSGNTWYDLSGNSNTTNMSHGEFASTHFISVEVPDYASRLEFYTPDSVSLNNAFSPVTGGWQIEEWIKIDDITYPESPAGTVVSSAAYSSGGVGFDWNHGNSMGIHRIRMGVGNNVSQPSGYDVNTDVLIPEGVMDFGKWALRSLFWNRSTNTMGAYVNGVFCGEIDISPVSGLTLYDGQGISWGTLYGWRHDGGRAGMKVYNRVLSAEEVAQNYNATKSRFI